MSLVQTTTHPTTEVSSFDQLSVVAQTPTWKNLAEFVATKYSAGGKPVGILAEAKALSLKTPRGKNPSVGTIRNMIYSMKQSGQMKAFRNKHLTTSVVTSTTTTSSGSLAEFVQSVTSISALRYLSTESKNKVISVLASAFIQNRAA